MNQSMNKSECIPNQQTRNDQLNSDFMGNSFIEDLPEHWNYHTVVRTEQPI